MTSVLVIQGAGMNMRGVAQIEIFGTETLDDINGQIMGYGEELGLDVTIFHSNIEGEVINTLYDAHKNSVDAALINPAGYTTSTGALPAAIAQVALPVYEVHASNPAARGTVSKIQPACAGSICGYGVYGYYLGLTAIKAMLG